MSIKHSPPDNTSIEKAAILHKLTVIDAALRAIIKQLSYSDNSVPVDQINHLLINLSLTLDYTLNIEES